MGKAVYLNVDNRSVLSTNITYDDLVWLYWNFKNTYGKLPTTNEGKSKFNMPQQRIIKRVLEESNITFNDFMLQFGKVSHVRTESNDFDYYVEKYKNISNSIGHALMYNELTNNAHGLPSVGWFIKHCPDKNVETYDDFIIWCGFESNKLKKDDDVVAKKLIQLEKDLGRPFSKKDITLENVGFTEIVVNRIWGSINNAKRELGLAISLPTQPKSFEHYSKKLLDILDKISKDKDRKFVSWSDIENPKYHENPTEHKTYMKSFKKQGIDLFIYLKENGYEMNNSKMGNTYTFDDGDKTSSIYEFDFSNFIRKELNMNYKIDYNRSVLYKTFAKIKSKADCDYVFDINGKLLYVEIAGVIYNSKSDNWRDIEYKTTIENDYKDKMIFKENLLLKNNKPYLFLFPWDMLGGCYKDKLINFIKDNK